MWIVDSNTASDAQSSLNDTNNVGSGHHHLSDITRLAPNGDQFGNICISTESRVCNRINEAIIVINEQTSIMGNCNLVPASTLSRNVKRIRACKHLLKRRGFLSSVNRILGYLYPMAAAYTPFHQIRRYSRQCFRNFRCNFILSLFLVEIK